MMRRVRSRSISLHDPHLHLNSNKQAISISGGNGGGNGKEYDYEERWLYKTIAAMGKTCEHMRVFENPGPVHKVGLRERGSGSSRTIRERTVQIKTLGFVLKSCAV